MLCTLLLLCAGVTLAMASSDRYYQANVSVKDNGSGLVYVNNTSSQPNYQPTSSKSGEGTAVAIPFVGTVLPTTDLYLYAHENDGWLLRTSGKEVPGTLYTQLPRSHEEATLFALNYAGKYQLLYDNEAKCFCIDANGAAS